MAEYLLKDLIQKHEKLKIENWEIFSAGVSAVKGAPVNEKAKRAMEGESTDFSDHRSHQITDVELEQKDLIITMTRKHSRFLVLKYPDLADKIFTLKEISGNDSKSKDIQDPFGLSEAVYRETRDEIKENLRLLLENVKKMS